MIRRALARRRHAHRDGGQKQQGPNRIADLLWGTGDSGRGGFSMVGAALVRLADL
jgi:hypothetical protein